MPSKLHDKFQNAKKPLQQEVDNFKAKKTKLPTGHVEELLGKYIVLRTALDAVVPAYMAKNSKDVSEKATKALGIAKGLSDQIIAPNGVDPPRANAYKTAKTRMGDIITDLTNLKRGVTTANDKIVR